LLAAGLTAAAVAAGLSALAPDPPPTVSVLAAARDLPGGVAIRAADVHHVALPPSAVPDGAQRDRAKVEGRTLAGPMRRGEPLTDVRFIGPQLLARYAADAADPTTRRQRAARLVAAPVRIADAGAVELLRPGDVVDVLAVPMSGAFDASGTDPTAVPSQATSSPAPPRPSSHVVGPDAPPTANEAPANATETSSADAVIVASAVRVLTVPKPTDSRSLTATSDSDGALLVLATTPTTAARLARAAATARLSVTLRSR
jgi:Flp pilus assembly protein CpaB